MSKAGRVSEGAVPAPEKDKDVMLFSIYPSYKLILKPARTRTVVEDGKVHELPVPGKLIQFKNNKALVPAAVAEKLKPKEIEIELADGRKVKHMKYTNNAQKGYGSRFWLEKEFFDLCTKDPQRRQWAKKIRAEVERRRALVDEIDDKHVDFFAIMETSNPGKVGKVETTQAHNEDIEDSDFD